ncbi:amidase family protein [Streptomyces sp. NPDC006552]|uniref:amidase family protein n=1 Tax=Streptomyces sp. NPDC006552 TaxID=3157179 RepID=UPI0033AEF34F
MDDGQLGAERLTRYFLDRIERVDPLLHAVIEVNPDALREARRLDAESEPRRPLHGIPVLLKDLLETADRMHTTAGSLALRGLRPVPPRRAGDADHRAGWRQRCRSTGVGPAGRRCPGSVHPGSPRLVRQVAE